MIALVLFLNFLLLIVSSEDDEITKITKDCYNTCTGDTRSRVLCRISCNKEMERMYGETMEDTDKDYEVKQCSDKCSRGAPSADVAAETNSKTEL